MSVLLLPSAAAGGPVALGLSSNCQHLRNGGAVTSPAKKVEVMWGEPHIRQTTPLALGGSGVPVLVNHTPVASMVGLSSPVATEVPIEMIDRDRNITLAQLTQAANSSAGLAHQLSWAAQLGSAQPGGQVLLMPNPSHHSAAAGNTSRPPIRRSSAIDTDDDKTGGEDSPNPHAGLINVDMAVGPFVAGDSVKVGESSGTSVGQIKLIHKYMERKKPLRHSGSQKSQDKSFEESPDSPHSSSSPSSPQKPPSTASSQGVGSTKPNTHSTSSSPTATSQPQPAAQVPNSSMLAAMQATGPGSKAIHNLAKPHAPGMVLVQTPSGIMQAPAGLVQTSSGLAPTPAGLAATTTGVIPTPTGLVQTSAGIVQAPAGLVAASHGQGALVYAPGIQGPVLVAHPSYPYQQWMQASAMAPYMGLTMPSGAQVVTPGMPSPIQQASKVATERHQPASQSPVVSAASSSSQRSPELASSGIKRRTSRLSTSLPDIKMANELLVNEEKKPRIADDNRRAHIPARGDRSPRMIHSTSAEYSVHQARPSHPDMPIKQVSEDTELADITGGPVYLLGSHGEGKLPPCELHVWAVCAPVVCSMLTLPVLVRLFWGV